MEIPYLLCSSSAVNAIIMFTSIMVAELAPLKLAPRLWLNRSIVAARIHIRYDPLAI